MGQDKERILPEHFLFLKQTLLKLGHRRRMLKGPAFISLVLHLSILKCYYQTYDDNIGPK